MPLKFSVLILLFSLFFLSACTLKPVPTNPEPPPAALESSDPAGLPESQYQEPDSLTDEQLSSELENLSDPSLDSELDSLESQLQ